MKTLKISSKYELVEIQLVVLATLLYQFRTIIPVLKFPFLILVIGLLIYSVIKYRSKYFVILKKFFSDYYLPIILLLVLVLSFLVSKKLYLSIFKDIVNCFFLFTLFFLMTVYIASKDVIKKFYYLLIRYLVFFGLLMSLLLLCNLFNVFPDHKGISSSQPFLSSLVRSISPDFNFALLPVFFGLISVFFLLSQRESFLAKVLLNMILIINSTAIIFCGSRRGIILLGILVLLILSAHLVSLVISNNLINQIRKSTRWFLVSLFILTFLILGFFFILPIKMKKNTLDFLGISIVNYKKISYNILSRYPAIFTNSGNYQFQKFFWNKNPDPLDPDSWWGSRIYSLEYPLVGDNVEIVPKNAIGYKMDKTCNADSWRNNAYSYTDISGLLQADSFPVKNKSFYASVYCFVSKDFNGAYAQIAAEGEASGNIIQNYNLNKKGTWQKLQINFEAKSGIPPVYLYWSKDSVLDFSSLTGCVIYAYPQYKRAINKTDHSQKTDEISFESNKFEAGFFFYKIPGLNIFNPLLIKQDKVVKWAEKFISEDTTYYGFKSAITLNTFSNDVIGERTRRWKFAWQLFKKEFSLKQKILGGGFSFLNWYGFYFMKDKTQSDYPHNPFLSILLYSGIVGLILYLVLIYKVISFYIRYLEKYFLFFIFFLMTFFFSFFSAGSPFDPPIMGFFILLPFFIHSFHKNVNSTIQKT